MALSKEDLQAIQLLLQPVQDEVTALRDDVTALRDDVTVLRDDVKKVNETVAKIEVDHGGKLGALYDAHVDTVRNAVTIRELDAKVDDHDHRLFALEQVVAKG